MLDEDKDYFWWIFGAAILFAFLLKMFPLLDQLIMGY